MSGERKQRFGLDFFPSLMALVDEARGSVPRQAFIQAVLVDHLESQGVRWVPASEEEPSEARGARIPEQADPAPVDPAGSVRSAASPRASDVNLGSIEGARERMRRRNEQLRARSTK